MFKTFKTIGTFFNAAKEVIAIGSAQTVVYGAVYGKPHNLKRMTSNGSLFFDKEQSQDHLKSSKDLPTPPAGRSLS